MSFLPFVLSFLLILAVGSTFLFTSFRSTSLERTFILAQNRAHLTLLSKRAVQDYKTSLSKKSNNPSNPQEKKEETTKPRVYKNKRQKRSGLDSSKFNLWPIINDKNASVALYKSGIRLLQILYQDADFYQNAHDPQLARKILDAMISKKGDDFAQLFPQDTYLAGIYYKMLKGTNTGYPSLQEYFKIEKSSDPPIRYAYATTPILRAVLGDDTTNRILEAEKASWEVNHRQRVLAEEKLTALLKSHPHPDFDPNLLKTFFSFDRKGKGSPHLYIEGQNKVMARK